jgi:predicted molibdopterin-dependent oxidoreductase YjgC
MNFFILLTCNGETCMVDINGKIMRFCTIVVKPYYRDETTEIPIDINDDGSMEEVERIEEADDTN